MKLVDRYNALITAGDVDDNLLQREVLDQLQVLADELEKSEASWFTWNKKKVKGLYLYGPVGVGKTFLIDLFYDCLPLKKKSRFHFHHFMQQIDAQLRRVQGQKDPLRLIAKEIAKATRILFFDEFLVDDVAYAMILAELLQALIREGLVIIVSSNTKPDDLYVKGVHRERFIPAINLIKEECTVMELSQQRDYRLGRQPLLDAYTYPLNDETERAMDEQFMLLVPVADTNKSIVIQGRAIPYIKHGLQSIWFAFNNLCNFPRSQLDYLEIADRFEHVFISGVPNLTVNHTAQAIMFINLIDVLYDRGIKVIISAAVPMNELYQEGELFEPFKRTLSRLNEMQSVDYLNRHPKREVQNIV
jgi:cell division protein ZapE